MEQQNKQPFQQEQTNPFSTKKFLANPKLSLVAAIVVIILVVGGILLLRDDNLLYQFEYQLNQRAEERLYGCTVDTECVLVKSEYCGIVFAVNQSKEAEWKEKDMRQAQIRRLEQSTCKPMPQEYVEIQNFKASCQQSRCQAVFTGNAPQEIDISTWQTYRNEEFGFEVKYPGIYDGECKPHAETTITGESIVRIGPIHVSTEDSEGLTLLEYVDQVIQRYEKAKDPSYSLESRSDITLGNKEAIQVVITWCGAGCNNPHTIYVEKGSKIYEFLFDDGVLNHCPIEPNELPSETALQILSTFRFVDPES